VSATYTTNLRLRKPGTGDALWGTSYNLDLDTIDTMLGGLAVQTLEVPSASLKITVAPGPYFLNGRFFWHSGTGTAQTLPANSTRVVYLLADEITIDAGTGDSTHPFPDSSGGLPVVPLGIVTTGPTTVTSITHWRYVPGPQIPFIDGPFANDAAAAAGGVLVGLFYRDSSGIVRVRVA
jgi:hypothetical protein